MICDVHAHYIPKRFGDFMGDRFTPAVGVPNPEGIARFPVSDSAADIQGRLDLMDAADIDRSCRRTGNPICRTGSRVRSGACC